MQRTAGATQVQLVKQHASTSMIILALNITLYLMINLSYYILLEYMAAKHSNYRMS